MSSIFSINQDSFIYAVRQALEARSNSKTGFNSHLKYTPFIDNTWEKPKESNLESLKVPLKAILRHHLEAIPHYKREEKVTLENISWFAHSTACLYADIAYLLQQTLEHEFLEKNKDNQELWDIITTQVNNTFSDYAILFNVYVDWKHTPKTTQPIDIDWNVRPPCGLAYKTAFKELFEDERRNRFGKKSFSKDHKNDSNRPSNDKKYDKSKKFSKEDDKKRTYDRNDRHKSRESNEANLAAARTECVKAIETMKKNTRIPEIPLSAQNSFVRREQHTLITEAGFHTDSRGEGHNRHVCILRESKK